MISEREAEANHVGLMLGSDPVRFGSRHNCRFYSGATTGASPHPCLLDKALGGAVDGAPFAARRRMDVERPASR